MTVIIKCQHSGIEFEASSKRTKQHPLVASFKNEAAGKRGDYRLACQALDKAAGIGGYETVEQYMELVNDIYTGAYDKKAKAEAQARREAKEREDRRREAKARREAQNRHLRKHGYTWSKSYREEYPGQWMDDEENTPVEWVLSSEDGRRVSTEQALDEIERGADVVVAELAEIIETGQKLPYEVWLTGELEAAADRKATADEAAKQAEIDAWHNAADAAKAGKVETNPFDYDGFETTFEQSKNIDGGGRIENKIFTGQINGVDCAVVYHYFGGHDYEETKRYWCADPEKAGVEQLPPARDYHEQRARELFI